MNSRSHRIVFLYSELAGYFLACAEALGQHPDVASVDVVHWPTHPEAPFQFFSTDHCTLHPKEKHDRQSLQELLGRINPTAIVGLPLLAYHHVGASSQFRENGRNGITFEHSAIVEALHRFLSKDETSLASESHASHELGTKYSPTIWSHTLLSLIEA